MGRAKQDRVLMEPLAYDAREVADLLKLSRGRGYALAREGNLPHVRLGRAIRFPRQAIEELVAGGKAPTTARPT